MGNPDEGILWEELKFIGQIRTVRTELGAICLRNSWQLMRSQKERMLLPGREEEGA